MDHLDSSSNCAHRPAKFQSAMTPAMAAAWKKAMSNSAAVSGAAVAPAMNVAVARRAASRAFTLCFIWFSIV
jgi:hypothetical protein